MRRILRKLGRKEKKQESWYCITEQRKAEYEDQFLQIHQEDLVQHFIGDFYELYRDLEVVVD